VPDYIIEWSRELEFDPILTPNDDLDVLGARVASLSSAFSKRAQPDVELLALSDDLENDLVSWAEVVQILGSPYVYRTYYDQDLPNAWNGYCHEYASPEIVRYWNKWRAFRIVLSRLQEELWRRSWPDLADLRRPVRDSEHFKNTRTQMTTEICIAAAFLLGNDSPTEVATGLLTSALPLILPLGLAGTCLLEDLNPPVINPGGSRMILVDRPLHLDSVDETSTQLAWVIGRLDFIDQRIGVKWAAAVNRWLRGEDGSFYNLSRSWVLPYFIFYSTVR